MEEYIDQYKNEILKFFEKNKISTDIIITKVVDVSTIRAYRNNNTYQPLSMYRVWAQENLIKNDFKRRMIFHENDFEKIHKILSEDLQNFWEKHDGKKLDKIYKVYKIVDLFFKGVTSWEELTLERRKFFLNNVHSPLDQFSMKFLKKYVIYLLDNIPENVTMSLIQNEEEKYFRFQKEIRRISNDFNITPYIFDEIAWRVGHQNTKKVDEYVLIKK